MLDGKEVVKTVGAFRELMNEVQEAVNICEAEIVEADKAFGDIRHFCELDYPTDRKRKTLVCQLMRDYGKRRRKAKDLLEVLKPLAELCGDKKFMNRIGRIANEAAAAQRRVEGERRYAPRVVEELFKKEEA